MTVLTLVVPIWNKGGGKGRGKGRHLFLFSHLVLVPQKEETLLRYHKEKQKEKLCHFVFQLIMLGCFGTERVNKVFSHRIFKNM